MEYLKFRFPMVFDKMAASLFKTEHHWKTEQRTTIGVPNAFDNPAPAVHTLVQTQNIAKLLPACLLIITFNPL